MAGYCGQKTGTNEVGNVVNVDLHDMKTEDPTPNATPEIEGQKTVEPFSCFRTTIWGVGFRLRPASEFPISFVGSIPKEGASLSLRRH